MKGRELHTGDPRADLDPDCSTWSPFIPVRGPNNPGKVIGTRCGGRPQHTQVIQAGNRVAGNAQIHILGGTRHEAVAKLEGEPAFENPVPIVGDARQQALEGDALLVARDRGTSAQRFVAQAVQKLGAEPSRRLAAIRWRHCRVPAR